MVLDVWIFNPTRNNPEREKDIQMKNLDYLAAKYGQEMGFTTGVEQKTVNTALNILHEQGIYAMFMWLHQKRDETKFIGQSLQSLFQDEENPAQLKNNAVIWSDNKNNCSAELTMVRNHFTHNLTMMFFCKNLISLTLTYARYAVKAR